MVQISARCRNGILDKTTAAVPSRCPPGPGEIPAGEKTPYIYYIILNNVADSYRSYSTSHLSLRPKYTLRCDTEALHRAGVLYDGTPDYYSILPCDTATLRWVTTRYTTTYFKLYESSLSVVTTPAIRRGVIDRPLHHIVTENQDSGFLSIGLCITLSVFHVELYHPGLSGRAYTNQ